MFPLDYHYLGNALAGLVGIPVRIYQEGRLLYSFFPVELPRDPMELYRREIFGISSHVGYFVTPLFHYYGVIRHADMMLVVGPTSQIMADDQKLRELAFRADVPREEIPAFLVSMHAIARLPVEKLLQLLCTVNYFLTEGEALTPAMLEISEPELDRLKEDTERRRTERVYGEDAPSPPVHNTLALEEQLMETVSRGDSEALRRWIAAAPAVRGGTVASDQLRQLRNMFIITATLASRAAIRGGMREDDAFTLSDGYIQQAELLTSHEGILNLQLHMLTEFTEQVEKLHQMKDSTRLARDVANYVRHHLSEPIRVEDIAEALYLSRPYLSARFKQDTGRTLTDFILNTKTEEAKRLLRYSDKSAAAIAAYLGFSSHGHFCRVFQKYTGLTPNEYRESV